MPISFERDIPVSVPGVRVSAVKANIKKRDRLDLVLFELADTSSTACVTTKNSLAASPVLVARRHNSLRSSKYWLVNTGYANAAMGKIGDQSAVATVKALAEQTGSAPEQILPFSTGVIGEPLPTDRVIEALPHLCRQLSSEAKAWDDVALGITTTDTQLKLVSKALRWQGQSFVIQGVAKGAGMIKPNMATMLGFIVTDIEMSRDLVERRLKRAVDQSFHRISVDGDTSTNDCVAFAATGITKLSNTESPDFENFIQHALNQVCLDLALQIVKDGEGATKLVHIECVGARSDECARRVCESIGHSPLVKTALFAQDPNWGRLLMAIGKSGAEIDVDRLYVALADKPLFANGGRSLDYDESYFSEKMKSANIHIKVDLKLGQGTSGLWTNDLSYDYVKINADYRS